MNEDPDLLEGGDGRSGPVLNPVALRSRDRRLSLATSLVAVLMGIAVLKPWGLGSAPAPSRPPRTFVPIAAPPTPRPTEDETADGLARPICLGAGAWRVASVERWRTHHVRVWRAVEPLSAASGPLDPGIPSVPVVALEIEALGWCAPGYGPERPIGPAEVTTWSVAGATATEVRLRQLLPERGTTPIAALYEPEGACAPGLPCPSPLVRPSGPWLPGRVVFRYEDLGALRAYWFAADVEVLTPPAQPEPGPSVRP